MALETVRRYPVVFYFLVAYTVSWTLWLPRVATVQGWWDHDVPAWWHYAGAAGPVSAAVVIAALSEGRAGIRSLLDQFALHRVRWPWLTFAVFCPVVLMLAGLVLTRVIEGEWPSYDALSRTDNLPALALPLTLLIHIVTFGIGEETGWRGFALPRLQREHSAIRATHVLAVGWGLWHVPTFFENESFMRMGFLNVVGWSAGLWMGAIFLTWLYNSSQGSLIVVVLWHGLFNLFSASEASGIVPVVITMGIIVTAMVALRFAGPEELTGLSRHAGHRERFSGSSPSRPQSMAAS